MTQTCQAEQSLSEKAPSCRAAGSPLCPQLGSLLAPGAPPSLAQGLSRASSLMGVSSPFSPPFDSRPLCGSALTPLPPPLAFSHPLAALWNIRCLVLLRPWHPPAYPEARPLPSPAGSLGLGGVPFPHLPVIFLAVPKLWSEGSNLVACLNCLGGFEMIRVQGFTLLSQTLQKRGRESVHSKNFPDDNCEHPDVGCALDHITVSTLNVVGVLMASCLYRKMSQFFSDSG